MNDIGERRPDFFEGQYLGADDLDALVTYLRNHDARHALGAHTWGIAAGLELIELPGPSGALDVYLLPGYAVDGYGRPILVVNPWRLTLDMFSGLGDGAVPLWLRFDEGPMQGVRRGFAVCDATDKYTRIGESYSLEAGRRDAVAERQAGVTIAGETFDDARLAGRVFDDNGPLRCDGAVPHQGLPRPADEDRWLVPLGLVGWSAGPPGQIVALTDEQRLQARRMRRHLGVVAEGVLAPGGVIRLRDRSAPFSPGTTVEEQCALDALQAADLRLCAGKPEPHELVWLEGRVRITGDTRIFGARLEFRDEKGRGYAPRNGQPGSTPLLVQRLEKNERDGQDLQLLVGKSDNGRNRLVVGQVVATEDAAKCTTSFAVTNRVVVQDDGKVGVGTSAPDRLVTLEGADSAYLNVRTTAGPHEVLIGANSEGAIVSAMTNDDLSLRAGGNSTKVTIKASGDVGIGTSTPQAKLDIAAVKATSGGGALGQDRWLQAGNGDDAGRFWVEYGSQAAPLLVLSDRDDPPRIQLQQAGAGQEIAPQFSSWIGHAAPSSSDLAMMGGRVGVGTLAPFVRLTVEGSLGFKSSAEPMVYIHESGTTNPERMVLAHSPARPDWGLSYMDSGALMVFKGAGFPVMTVDLGTSRVGVGTSAPAERLDVRGNVKLGAVGELFAPGSADNLRIIAGAVMANGVRSAGNGFNALQIATGRYKVQFIPGFPAAPVVLATAVDSLEDDNVVTARNVTASGFDLVVRDASQASEGDYQSTAFSFVAFGLRG